MSTNVSTQPEVATSGRWRVRAVFENEAGEVDYTDFDERFTSQDAAMAWINGEEGDLASEAATIDTRSDPTLAGFWLEDLEPVEA